MKELCHPPDLWHQHSPNPSTVCLGHYGIPNNDDNNNNDDDNNNNVNDVMVIIMIIMLPGHHGVPQFSNRGSLAHCSSPDASAQHHQPDPCFRQLSPPLLSLLPSFHPTSRTTSLRRCRATFRWCFRASEAKRLDNNGDLQRGQPSLSSFQRTEVDLPCQHGDLRVKWKWEQRYERRSHQ